MEIIGFDGFDFASLGYRGGHPWASAKGQWTVQPQIVRRQNNTPLLSSGAVLERVIDVDFVIKRDNEDALWLAIDKLIGILNPVDQTPRTLRGRRYDGAIVTRTAIPTLPNGMPTSSVNSVWVRFISSDPKWLKETSQTFSTPIASDAPALPLPNSGQAHVHPVYTITPGGLRTTKSNEVGWEFRRILTITNNTSKSLIRHPYRLDMGDTDALVTASKMLANGDDLRIILNGANVRRDLVGINSRQTFVWFVIEELAVGESIDYEVIYGNALAGTASTMSRVNKPVFDIGGESGAATSGSTTALNNSGAVWEADRWKDATLFILTGTNAGQSRNITGNTATQLQFSALGASIVAGVAYTIAISHNGKWVYATRQTDRGSDPARGRWYVSSGESPPEETLYGGDAVGAWYRELYYDNRDKKGQRRWSRVSHGGDIDTFTLLDAYRTYETGPSVPEEGAADGVAISLPIPITNITCTTQLKNPNGICKGFVGGRISAGDDWEEIDSESAASDVLTDWTISNGGLSYLHLYMGLIPNYDDEIGTEWKGDSGSTSSAGSSTTTNDATKNWKTDQFKNGVLRFKSGTLSGQTRPISGNSANQITTTAFTGSTPADASYEIIGASLQAHLIDKNRLVLTLDDSDIDATFGSETDIFQHVALLRIGGGTVAAPRSHARVRIGQESSGLVFTEFSPTLESIVLDSENRTAYVHDGTNIVRYLTDPCVIWEYGVGSAFVKAAGGMPLPIGVNQLTNPTAATNVTGWSITATAGITANLSRDTFAFYDGAGSFKIAVTGNSAAAGATIDLIPDAFIAIDPGSIVSFVAAVELASTDFTKELGMSFYDASQTLLSTVMDGSPVVDSGDWVPSMLAAEAPADAAYVKPFVRFEDPIGGSTGSVYADAMDVGSPVLELVDEVIDAPLLISATYTEGFLG